MEKISKESLYLFLRKARFLLLLVTVIGILVEIFSPLKSADLFVLFFAGLWLAVMTAWQLEANFSFAAALFFLLISLAFTIFVKSGPLDNDSPAEKAALWFYIFFVIGIAKRLLENKKGFEEKVRLLEVIKLVLTRSEREESLELMKEWSLERQKKMMSWKNMARGITRLSVKLLRIRIKHFLGEFQSLLVKLGGQLKLCLRLLMIRLKLAWVRITEVLKLIWLWLVKETKNFFRELFDFSTSPTLNFVKSGTIQLVSNKITNLLLIKLPIFEVLIFYFIILRLVKEVKFYQWFYEKVYLDQLIARLLPDLLLFWTAIVCVTLFYLRVRPRLNRIILARFSFKNRTVRFFVNIFLFYFGLGLLSAKKSAVVTPETKASRQLKNKWIFLAISLPVLYFGNKHIFWKERDKFEFFPYITRVDYEIASRYFQVVIFGHNFKEMPFKGRVLINGNEQRVVEWGDKKVVVEIDPILSGSGELKLINDYGFGKNIESNAVRFTYFDSRKSSAEDEKRFWETLKEKARKSSFEIDG